MAVPAAAPGRSGLLPRSVLLCYSLPGIALSFSFLLIGLYFLKYATDVLLIAPALMGVLFAASRFWDGAADPLAGYLSDRTRTRLGRRRSWLAVLSRRFGKHRCWSAALWCLGIAYALLYFVLGERIASTPSQLVVTALLTTLLGALQSSHFVLSNSMQADVVDWDEERTGERKEGAYLAVLSFAEKCAAALAAAAVGFVLEWVGYVPGGEQNHATHVALLAMASFAPAVCHFVAAFLLTGFGLGEQEHARIRAVLTERSNG
jgi:Na+/melibiose symporter-like transporter